MRRFTLGIVLANRRSSSLCESFPFTVNFPKGVRSITPTFSITSLHSLPTGLNQLVRLKLGLSATRRNTVTGVVKEKTQDCSSFKIYLVIIEPLYCGKTLVKTS